MTPLRYTLREYGSQNAASGKPFRAWRYDVTQGSRVVFTNRNTITSRAEAEASARRVVGNLTRLAATRSTPFARSLAGSQEA